MIALERVLRITALLLISLAAPGLAQDYDIDWWTIDGGGAVLTETADGSWQLSGTIGQWDSTEARVLSGGSWKMTGGFWSLSVEELADILFQDRFEADESQPDFEQAVGEQ